MSEGSVTVHEITKEECQRIRRNALRRIGMTLAQYRELSIPACCVDCVRPEGVSDQDWRLVDAMEFFLAGGRRAR